ncbi:AMP-binding protein [Streptacidiphilus jiangxiensis]|uniref:Fatty-acyl-CoA synthase n=1 Tax=Streptacidiphilus jiangxiensis TaxID=235985 RepID=A0A1H7HV43_STRJI|nr:AMP-binding protein [Streptacidiphilus jiangxiensis]SEK53527.1 fatty-acyl-CoA synthase [Streptacidiphilus jiangxiensis]
MSVELDPGLSHRRGAAEPPLPDATVSADLARTARTFPDHDALVERATGRRWTYAAFDAAVDDVARGLLAAGVQVGDRVGIWSPNCAEWVLTQYAAARAGAILVNLNPAYRQHEIAYALQQSGTRLLISATRVKTSDYVSLVQAVRDDCPELERVVFIGTPDWDALVEGGTSVPLGTLREREAGLTPDDPVNIQYTSGTTGRPKGATLSHRNILGNGFQVAEVQGWTAHDRVCVPVPFYHCFGMVMANLGATSHGSCIVVPGALFDPVEALDAVEAERCTVLYGVPTMFIAELAQLEAHPGRWDLSSLRTGVMAGSPCPVEVMKRVMAEMGMAEVTIAYGMTETSPVSTQTRPDDSLEHRVATVGRVHPHVEVKVVDPETGATAPVGTPGELCTRGYSVMIGYWNEPERTAEAVDADGWMHTGDLAEMAADGYVSIVGRIKDMVIRGGENVYPREVEEFLYTHPDIEDVQVIGVPDARYGEELMAWVKLRPGAPELTTEQLRDYCAGKLAHYKIPRYVHLVDAFPMTVTGKVRKVEMRDEARKLLGL